MGYDFIIYKRLNSEFKIDITITIDGSTFYSSNDGLT